MVVHISRDVLEQILAQAAAASEMEVCGLLLGGEGRITEARPAANVADDPAHRFELDPAVLIAAYRAARAGGAQILGHYHSHPGGNTEPSVCDAAMADVAGALWLICAPNGGYALWRAGTDGLHGRFTRNRFEVEGQ